MPELCPQKDCTGCGSCATVCACQAIAMEPDEDGFLRPVIDTNSCVECGQCVQACPILHPVKRGVEKPPAFAAWHNDEKIRLRSASGGLFSVFAQEIIAQGGVVFGVKYDQLLNPVFDQAETVEDLAKFRTSKYVQADPGRVYESVAKLLQNRRIVLFTGTPCQVAALHTFLRETLAENYRENLYTIDLVCEGVPSPSFYHKWLEYLEKKHGKIHSLNMRPKRGGWENLWYMRLETEAGVRWHAWETHGGSYGYIFVKGLPLRDSCYTCHFANSQRQGDLTISDFWGIGSVEPFPYDKKNGISLCLANSVQGEKLLKMSQDRGTFISRSTEEAVRGNTCLRHPLGMPANHAQFLADVRTQDFATLARRYGPSLGYTFSRKLKFRTWAVLSVIFRVCPWSYPLFRVFRNTVYRLIGKKIPS